MFVATIDLRAGSPTRGRLVGTLLVADTAGRVAHHTEHALAHDVSDPAHPREGDRLTFPSRSTPHWLAADATGRHLVTTSGSVPDAWVYLVTLDRTTGARSADADVPAADFSRVEVPGLGVVRGMLHGAVFGPAPR